MFYYINLYSKNVETKDLHQKCQRDQVVDYPRYQYRTFPPRYPPLMEIHLEQTD